MFKRFFQKNRKLLSGLFVVVLLLVAFTPVPAHAAGFCDIWVIGEGVCGLVLVPMQISAMILYIAGILFDFVIQFTIVDITKNLSNITGINIAWAVIRDLVNISFIFILLYAAIQAILNNTTGHIKQLIVGVVIAAILINFSLFFTKIIIDGSNLVTLTFQKSMTAKCEGKLSFCVMQNLGLPTTYKTDKDLVQSVDGYNEDVLTQVHGEIWKAIILSIGSSIFFLITAFIFLAASVMFAMRFVTIVFLLIFSPLAVIGSILPKLSQKKDEWWSELTEQAIFPALFMLLMWVVLTILASPGFITRKGSISGALIGGAKIDSPEGLNNLSMIFNFGIIIAFMIGVLTISKGYSKRGGAMGGKFAGTIMGGTSGYVGRRTIGRKALSMANDDDLKERAKTSMAARLQLRAAQSVSKSSLDVRSSAIGGYFGSQLGAGKAEGKGGFAKIAKDKEKKEKEFAESLKVTDRKKEEVENNLEPAKRAYDSQVDEATGVVNSTEAAVSRRKEEAAAQAESLVAKSTELESAERSLAQWETMSNNPNIVLRDEARAKADQYRAEVERLTNLRKDAVQRRAEIIFNRNSVVERAAFEAAKAEKERVQKGDNAIRAALVAAQKERDRIKGVSGEEKERKERVKNLMREENMDEEQAKAALFEREGISIKMDSVDKVRQEAYAKTVENPGFISPNRVGFVGKPSQESLGAATAIRKQAKSESAEQRMAKAAKEMAKKEIESESSDTTPSPAPTASPSDSTPPATPTP